MYIDFIAIFHSEWEISQLALGILFCWLEAEVECSTHRFEADDPSIANPYLE